ncbi:MAG: RNA polymerase factor sigma-54 [Thermoanaerobaculaceae bacterium]|nr:RNA polymerase factor sigma-54 [Thermoanaerobaculaceae bacterium]MDI9621737.1 RNA polymerase factor sigma-54 [Acidobacteriota bacterium]NLH12207.1 RNA polymerase factor sigma-54 [Holophagae bacterium]HPW56024.1 RNA polymerase factor sigma-54 [Thermoanaerobaculaceae bacterium]
MALEQRLNLKLAQKLVMTPTLQQAIKLLQLSRLELEQALVEEVQVNPLLEMSEDAPADEETQLNEEASSEEVTVPNESEVATRSDAAEIVELEAAEEPATAPDAFEEVELEALFSNYLHDVPVVAPTWDDDEDTPVDNASSAEQSLYEALCEQVRLVDVRPELLRVCEFIIGNLEPDGYLRLDVEELANQLGVDVELVHEAIAVVQRLDPPGIGARDLRECLLLQIDRQLAEGGEEFLGRVREVVAVAFSDVLNQRWEALKRRFGLTHEEVRSLVAVLRRLTPHPGAALGPTGNSPVEPDVEVRRMEHGWQVSLVDDGLPRLQLSSRYARMLQGRSLDSESRAYLRERMRSALWFLRSVEQRQSTILKVAQAIVRRQSEFLEHGVAHLKPLVLRDIADDIGMHESTVSRVVANKYIATPRGVLPLKYFFHSAIASAVEGDLSSMVVKQRIKELIGGEDPDRPLSDARIARQLNRVGVRIARRTVAKYREEQGILSSEQRRRALR